MEQGEPIYEVREDNRMTPFQLKICEMQNLM